MLFENNDDAANTFNLTGLELEIAKTFAATSSGRKIFGRLPIGRQVIKRNLSPTDGRRNKRP
jgi:hypothetical protein